MATIFPPEFADLEPFADWAIPTERARYAKRIASTMEELDAFYNVAFPLLESGTSYLEKVEMDTISEEDKRLLWLFCALVTVAFPVEAWRQPRVPDAGASSIDAILEPAV
ncbi:hypothetical protein H1V43_19855 [Streptomyces sp. PSKA54]|uniref:Xaa-Pro dipeptidase n=1 Tax=Streptomyces himalayensis subsp. aureolus TaxID=2758039 RepID=A0A7W2D2I2_9ACTN|nr:hypothetical protein [Streptomyces himalayensis]MBA4863599.1 hypothetical protein [Streptomyces himalayensis subsp. aureolus]